MNDSQNPIARKEGLVIQEMPNEVLVYDTNTNRAHCLNQTAAFIWKSCDGKTTVNEISRLVGAEFGGSVNEDFVWLALDQLNKDNLLQEEINSKLAGVSRREAIRKIGLASIIALPVVASLAVPNTVLAVSSCAGPVCCGAVNVPAGCPAPIACSSPCTCSNPGGPGTCA
jgi:hypothetical protein